MERSYGWIKLTRVLYFKEGILIETRTGSFVVCVIKVIYIAHLSHKLATSDNWGKPILVQSELTSSSTVCTVNHHEFVRSRLITILLLHSILISSIFAFSVKYLLSYKVVRIMNDTSQRKVLLI